MTTQPKAEPCMPEGTREEFIASNSDLVRKVKGRWGITHFELKTRVGDYQKVGQITSDSAEGVLGKYYDTLKSDTLSSEPRRPDLTCPLCGSNEDVVVRLKHVGGYDLDVEVITCRDETACWARWDEQHLQGGIDD